MPGCLVRNVEFGGRFARVSETLLDLLHLARRTAPTVVVIALRIFR
jgi:hypothetical protein